MASTQQPWRFFSGVPQRSLLGPRLFSIFTNELSNCLDLSNPQIFADHSTTYVTGDSADSISTHIQNVLQQLQNWARCNCISIHHVKTEIMFESKMPFIGPILPITLENNLFNRVSHSLSLGVTLDNKLCWTPHMKSITANFNANLNKLKPMN